MSSYFSSFKIGHRVYLTQVVNIIMLYVNSFGSLVEKMNKKIRTMVSIFFIINKWIYTLGVLNIVL